MISRCVALLAAALTLASCCVSGSGCAPLGGGPVALDDGLGAAPPEEAQTQSSDPQQPKPNARPRRKNMVGSLDARASGQDRGAQATEQFELEQAASEADDARLRRKLIICSDCMPPKSARDDTMSSSNR
jgi:hypothetical protein